MSIHLAFYEPEIPGNVGTLIRLSACWRSPLELIGPLGFVWSDRHLKRAGLDYFDKSTVRVHASWQAYCACVPGRKIALVPHAQQVYTAFSFQKSDTLVLGCESSGLPGPMLTLMDACVRIPSVARSLNAAVAGSIAWAEALRQTNLFPTE
jgi:tRNA (cytidine/uridine-2'-O-)-methyltransferase